MSPATIHLTIYLAFLGYILYRILSHSKHELKNGMALGEILDQLDTRLRGFTALASLYLLVCVEHGNSFLPQFFAQMPQWWRWHGSDLFAAYFVPAIALSHSRRMLKSRSEKQEKAAVLISSLLTLGATLFINLYVKRFIYPSHMIDWGDIKAEIPLNILFLTINWYRVKFQYSPPRSSSDDSVRSKLRDELLPLNRETLDAA